MSSWNEIVHRFKSRAGDLPFHGTALAFLESLDPAQPVLVACSGGADSVYLVLSLFSRPGKRLPLHVLHFNHGVRGHESDKDAAFVKEMAETLGLAISIGSPEKPLEPDEASLRAARYQWMQRRYVDLNASGLCLGHHADDLLESQILALATGSGPSGLASPMPVRRFSDGHYRVRPLLSLSREQIEEALTKAGASWREDASNADAAYTRNRLRKDLVPLLKDLIPQDVLSGSSGTQSLMSEALEVLDAAVESLQIDFSDNQSLMASRLSGQPAGVVRRALQAWWLRHHADRPLSKSVLNELVVRLGSGKSSVSLSIGEGDALRTDSSGRLFLTSESEERHVESEEAVKWNWQSGPLDVRDGMRLEGNTVRFQDAGNPPFLKANPDTDAWLNVSDDELLVRYWLPGDRYQPLGAPGNRKLQDLFVDAKIESEQKHCLPVILNSSGDILWVPGFPPGEPFRLATDAKSALKLTYKPLSSG